MKLTAVLFVSLAQIAAPEISFAADPARGCYGVPYASTRGSGIKQSIFSLAQMEAAKGDASSGPVNAENRVRVVEQPLGFPIELGRIRNGVVFQWVGGFINDGLASFSGIDLDRMDIISISRRTYDSTIQKVGRVGDPMFSNYDNTSIVRKWSNDTRTEIEVVTHKRLHLDQAEAFVCIANSAWASESRDSSEYAFPRMSDTLVSESWLRASVAENGKTIVYARRDHRSEPLEALTELLIGSPMYKW